MQAPEAVPETVRQKVRRARARRAPVLICANLDNLARARTSTSDDDASACGGACVRSGADMRALSDKCPSLPVLSHECSGACARTHKRDCKSSSTSYMHIREQVGLRLCVRLRGPRPVRMRLTKCATALIQHGGAGGGAHRAAQLACALDRGRRRARSSISIRTHR